jgi:hypothetical protein
MGKSKKEKKTALLSTNSKWSLDTGLDSSSDVYFSMRNPNQLAKEKLRIEEENLSEITGKTKPLLASEGKNIGETPLSKNQKKAMAKKQRESKAEKWFGLPSQENLSDEVKVEFFFPRIFRT